MNQLVLNEVLEFLGTYEQNLPTDTTQISAAAIQATTLINNCFDDNLRGDFPPTVLKLLTLQARLQVLAETSARRAKSQQRTLRAYTKSERLAIAGLQRAVANLEKQLNAASPYSKARIAAALEVTRGELRDRIELQITARHSQRQQELQREISNIETRLDVTEHPTAKAYLQKQLAALRQEISQENPTA